MILVPSFPRQLSFPQRKFVKTKEEFQQLISFHNGNKNIFYSLYNVDEDGTFSNAKIDKVFFDLDGEQAFADLTKLKDYCLKQDYKFLMLYSGKKGFHFYIFCQPATNRFLLRNAHLWFNKHCGVSNDVHIIGDIARVSRVPNTFHITGQKYCIPIMCEDVVEGLDFIKQKAVTPQPKLMIYGKKLLDLSLIPSVATDSSYVQQMSDVVIDEVRTADPEKLLKLLPLCAQKWVTAYEYSNHRNRFLFAVACLHSGLTPGECDYLARHFYSKFKERNGNRTRYQEFQQEQAILRAFSNKFFVPSCDKLISERSCPGKCSEYCSNLFPLYKETNGG